MVLDGDGNRWNAHVDPASGNTYYVNERTGVSQLDAAQEGHHKRRGIKWSEPAEDRAGRRDHRGPGVLPAGGLGAARGRPVFVSRAVSRPRPSS